MSEAISWVLELAVQDGQAGAVKPLVTEMSDATQTNEEGALAYEWYVSEDGGTVHIYERYADSVAALIHLDNFGRNFAERFLTIFAPVRLVVYGEPTDQLRDALAGLGATHLGTLGGFTR